VVLVHPQPGLTSSLALVRLPDRPLVLAVGTSKRQLDDAKVYFDINGFPDAVTLRAAIHLRRSRRSWGGPHARKCARLLSPSQLETTAARLRPAFTVHVPESPYGQCWRPPAAPSCAIVTIPPVTVSSVD
jgi:hypothetical protein